MTSTQSLHITLPANVADMVQAKVASGEYANASEVVSAGMHALLAREQAIEQWLKKAVVASYDAMQAAPEQAIPIGEMQKRILQRRMAQHVQV